MCLRRISSSLRILNLGLFDDGLPEVTAEVVRRSYINLPPDNSREFPLDARQPEQSRYMRRVEFNEYVNIAIRPKVISQYRAKQCKFADVVLLANPGYPVSWNENTGTHWAAWL
jgi:hypothetical protein